MGFRSPHSHSTRQFSLLFLKAFPQGKHRLDKEASVQTGKAPSRRHRAVKNAILRCPGLRCMGFRSPPKVFLWTKLQVRLEHCRWDLQLPLQDTKFWCDGVPGFVVAACEARESASPDNPDADPTSTASITLADLVRTDPEAARELEQLEHEA